MKIFKIMAVALVAMLGFTACDKECGHEFIEVDYSADLVGTWTCLEADLAQAFVFNADGTATTTGVENGKYWENVNVTWTLKNNKLTLSYGDNTSETLINIVSGKILSIADKNGDNRRTFQYCANDLADEIVGMWVCNDGPQDIENEVIIRTYNDNGKVTTTGVYTGEDEANPILGSESNYTVIGDLVFKEFPKDIADKTGITHNAERLIYTPKATASGDIMTLLFYLPVGDNYVESRSSYLRIKQHLELPGMKYDYIKTFVTNVKGLDKDIEFMGTTFNFAKMNSVKLDKMLKTLLFAVEFPDANTIRYSGYYNGENIIMEAPIVVDGNKMTVKMSSKNAALKDVDLYTFQDQDNTQMHMYMHSTGFVNFFGNMQVTVMEQMDLIDTTDAAAVKAVFDSIDEAVETINVSLVMTKAAR